MNIAILGAGFSGLTAALELHKAGHEVTIYEKSNQPGGAAGGFMEKDWDWYVDFAYHHWFTNDSDAMRLCEEIGWKQIVTRRPITASMYSKKLLNTSVGLFEQLGGENTVNYKLDSPLDLLRFPRLSLFERIRAGMILALLKFGPPFSAYHRTTSYELLGKLMGKKAFSELFQPLFEKKFGEYAPEINTMFMWARITKRTPALSYPEGGFQALANFFAQHLQKKGVNIIYNAEVTSIARANLKFEIRNLKSIQNSKFEILINTLPSPVFLKLEQDVLPENYRKRLAGIQYLGAQTIILETKKPILDQVYWLNLTQQSTPWMVAIQHTNFMDKKHFNSHHVFYLATYTNIPIKDNGQPSTVNVIQKWDWFTPYAQPLYTTDYVDRVPTYKTPVSGLYFANMEMAYPYDRGTNYAVKIGKEVAKAIIGAGKRT